MVLHRESRWLAKGLAVKKDQLGLSLVVMALLFLQNAAFGEKRRILEKRGSASRRKREEDRMPTLSNGSELTVWSEPDNPNPSPDAGRSYTRRARFMPGISLAKRRCDALGISEPWAQSSAT